MFLQLVPHVGGRYGARGVGGVGRQLFVQLQPGAAGRRATRARAALWTWGVTPTPPSTAPAPGSGFRRPLISFHSRTSPRNVKSDGTVRALFNLQELPAARVPGLTAAELVANERAGARRGGGGHQAVPSLVPELASALLNAQPGALADAGQQVRFPLAQLLLAAVQRQVGVAQLLRNPKGGDAQPPVRHGRP